MSGEKIRLVGNHIPNRYIFKKRANNETYMEGNLAFVVDFLAKTFKGNYVLLETKGIGAETSPGNWSGCVGMLHRNEADVYAGHFAMDPKLIQIVGYTNTLEEVTVSVLSGPPNTLHQKAASLMSSLDMNVWCSLIVSWIFISILYWKIIPLEAKFLQIKLPEGSLVSIFLVYYGLLFQRGFDNLPTTLSLRLLASGWLIFVIIFSTGIAGTFSSKLAITDKPERIDSLADILKYPNIRPYITKGTIIDSDMMNSKVPYIQRIWRKIQSFNGDQPPPAFFRGNILDEVSAGSAVIISWREPLLNVFVSHDCKKRIRPYYVAKKHVLSLPVIFMYRKGLDREHVESLNRMAASHAASGYGILNFRLAKQFAQPCYQEAFIQKGYTPFTLQDTAQIFKILMFGSICNCLVLVAECILGYSKKKKLTKTLSQSTDNKRTGKSRRIKDDKNY